ncbi:MAG: hypothetical protein KJ970_09510 [Candidatus Eisenbacteria bacterium]|uniref:Right-handed parallel beta-helix repeat-containing protein n=1 Tax=Eiseniibacteriota bacterium TaxID=2212470 RepID=A0A948RUK3_UNCEI|nr:hypothetical protein [Candidatus Eisenbacteria bacterium]MBU1950504.1 hypothetical protein [Candidatus Eisenbacteria bacterium]MBU2691155.1 hypothetical protein [Candidatus Eisenbacteria bacterium]
MSRKLIFTSMLAAICLVSCGDGDSGTQPTVDTTDPAVTILQPVTGATVPAGNVIISAQATDNEEIAKVEFYVDGSKIGEDASGAANIYVYTWDATGLANGSAHTLRARALDTSGNGADASVMVTICPCPTGPTYHAQNIDANETWRACCNPHIVTESIGIENGATLTIQPGCIVRIEADKGFVCGWGGAGDGALIAVGKPDSTILFTSNESPAAPGDWFGFTFHDATLPTTRFSYCTIEYAGRDGEQALLLDFGAVVKMDHSTIQHSAGKGIAFSQQGSHMAAFTNNTITGCADYPLEVEPEYVRELGAGNSFTGNAAGKNAITVYYGIVETSGTWRHHGVPYRVPEGHGVGIGSQTGTAVVTIEPGTVIQFGLDAYLHVGYTISAGLIAEGTVANPITFTSEQANPQPGDWRHIYISGASVDAQCRLKHCVIEYGGGVVGALESIAIEDALPSITDCEINHSAGYGISLGGGEYPDPATLEGSNSFTGNAGDNVHIF